MSAPLKKSSCKSLDAEDCTSADDVGTADEVGSTEEETAADVGATDDEERLENRSEDMTADDKAVPADESVSKDEEPCPKSADETGSARVDEDKIIEEDGKDSEELLHSESAPSEESSIPSELEYCELSTGVEAGSSPQPDTSIEKEAQTKLEAKNFKTFMSNPTVYFSLTCHSGFIALVQNQLLSYVKENRARHDKSIIFKNTS